MAHDNSFSAGGGSRFEDGAGGTVAISGASFAEIQDELSARILPGYVYKQETIFFGILGVTAAKVKQAAGGRYEFVNVFNVGTRTFDENFGGQNESHVVGPTFGAGVEHHFGKKLSMRLSYMFTYYPASSGSANTSTLVGREVPSNGDAGSTGVYFTSSGSSGGEAIHNHEITLTAVYKLG